MNELMKPSHSADHYKIAYMCVSGKAAFVGYGAVMPYFHVMGKMDIFHNKTVVAHSGRLAFADSPVHSNILTAHEVIAYPNPGSPSCAFGDTIAVGWIYTLIPVYASGLRVRPEETTQPIIPSAARSPSIVALNLNLKLFPLRFTRVATVFS